MPKDTTTLGLTELGLTSYEAAAYLTLLRRDSFTASELSQKAHIPRQRIYDVIDSLTEKGLCQLRTSSPCTLAATEPVLALTALSTRLTGELEGRRDTIAARGAEVTGSLQSLYKEGRGQETPLSYVHIYRDRAQIAAVARELARAAQEEIKLCLRGPAVFDPGVSAELLGDALTRGVSCRALCTSEVSLGREFGSLLARYSGRGLAVRRLEGSGFPAPRALVFDDHAVLLFFPEPLAGPPSFQTVVIRHPEMLLMMNFTFESLWGLREARAVDAQGHSLS